MRTLTQHFPALLNRRFVQFLIGNSVSGVGNSFNTIALNLLLYSKTQDVAGISLMWIVRTLARLLLQPYLGVLVDRSDRYKLLLATQALNAVVAFGFVFVTGENLWLLYVLVFALQTFDGLFGPAVNSIIPQVVPKEELLSANVVASVASKVAATLGGVLGAVLYARYSATTLFTLNALSFVVALLTIIPLRASVPPATRAVTTWWSDLVQGIGVIRQFPLVSYVFIIMFTNSLVWRLFEVLIVPLVGQTQFGQSGLGYLYSALTVGGFLGAFVATRVAKRFTQAAAALSVSFALTSLPFAVLGLTQDGWAFVAAMVCSGVLLDIVGIYSTTSLQAHVPNEMLGRVFAFQNVAIALGGLPALLSLSPLTNAVGFHVPFLMCAAVVLGVAVVFGLYTVTRTRRVAGPAALEKHT